MSKFAEPTHFCIIRASTTLYHSHHYITHINKNYQCTHKGVKGAMEVGMSSCEESNTEEERPGVLDDALKDATGWIDVESTNNIPVIHQKYP